LQDTTTKADGVTWEMTTRRNVMMIMRGGEGEGFNDNGW